jgi:hypothetical protein
MFFRRGVADDDPWLRPKLWLFSVGALLALLGMGLENGLLIGAAAAVLIAGLALRFVKPRPDEEDAPEPGDG